MKLSCMKCLFMVNQNRKDFNGMLNDRKDMPKFHINGDEKILRNIEGRIYFFTPPKLNMTKKCGLCHLENCIQ